MTPDQISDALIALLQTDPCVLPDDLLWRLESRCVLAGRRLGQELATRAQCASRRFPILGETPGASRSPGARSLRGVR